jgi:hypothetical protein
MFIKPIQESAFPDTNWTQKAGNPYFSLQVKSKKNLISSLFPNQPKNVAVKYSDYDYRILLILNNKKQNFVISVGASFSNIHNVNSILTAGLEFHREEFGTKIE